MSDALLADNATRLGEMVRAALCVADRAVVEDLEDLPTEPTAAGGPVHDAELAWRDTRPLLDPREHAPQVIDMTRQALYYADLRRLISRHPTKPHLVRIVKFPR